MSQHAFLFHVALKKSTVALKPRGGRAAQLRPTLREGGRLSSHVFGLSAASLVSLVIIFLSFCCLFFAES